MEALQTERLRVIDHDIESVKIARSRLDQYLAQLREMRARIVLFGKGDDAQQARRALGFVPADSLDQESCGNGFISPGSLVDQRHPADDGSQIDESERLQPCPHCGATPSVNKVRTMSHCYTEIGCPAGCVDCSAGDPAAAARVWNRHRVPETRRAS
jgi:hypothetical protein